MKLHTKWLLLPVFSAVLAMLPINQSHAHRAQGAAAQARQLCGASAGRQALARMRGANADPELLAIADLIALECLYRREGKSDQVEALYKDALDKAKHPLLRSVAYRRLARMAWRKGDHAAAEELLQRSLHEKLK